MKYGIFLVIFLSSIILTCSKFAFKNENSQFVIKTKEIKETGISQNGIPFEVDAKIPVIENMDLSFEKMVKKWISEKNLKTENIDEQTKQGKDHYSSNFEVFYNNNIGVVSILYDEYKINSLDANGEKKYYALNLRGTSKIEIYEIISKDQFDSLVNILRDQVKENYLKDLKDEEFENKFQKYKYYFKNNDIIIFYDPYVIASGSMGKIEFIFPVYKNTEETHDHNQHSEND